MRRLILGVALVLGVAGCSTLGRLSSYGSGLADANFNYEGYAVSASMHPTDDVILFRPALAQGLGGSFARGLTLGLVGQESSQAKWSGIANGFLAGAGCRADTMDALDPSSGYWEVAYVCPDGVNLRQLMADQRGDLRRGEPLRR